MFFEKTVLHNGLTVISEKMSSVQSVCLGIWVSVGSRDESLDQAGLSHFMEHMMFKGTSTLSATDISSHFDSMGAEFNAFTGREYTCFYARFISSKLEEALGTLSNMIIDSQFFDESIETERQVVLEEIARSLDDPDDAAYELFCQSIHGNHPVGRPVLGNPDLVAAYSHDDCAAFHSQFYHGGNITVSAAGDVDHQALVSLCEKLFSSIKSGTRQERALSLPDYQPGIFAKQMDTEQAHIYMGIPWIRTNHEDRYTAGVLNHILGGSMSSRLFNEVREKRGLVYSIYSMASLCLGTGTWCVYAGTRNENIKQVLSLIEAELQNILSEGVTEEEVNRAASSICGSLVLGQETTTSHMSLLGKRECLGLNQVSLQDSLASYQKVTATDVEEFAKRYLDAPITTAIVSSYSLEQINELLV
ncbi:MAG: M16 family metallopeptidase [Anaerotardibacter sp.]